MQERYLGDAHDFIKFGLLFHLQRELRVRVGVNWYKTDPTRVDKPKNNDGEKRSHIKRPTAREKDGVWRKWNGVLFDQLEPLQDPTFRTFENFQASGILPSNTLYFERELRPEADREKWHSEAVAELSSADLIFLDPDNGFQVSSCTQRTRPKYTTYSEARSYVRGGKIVVGIQFARQCDPEIRGDEVRAELMREEGSSSKLPILRGRLTPNILFLTLCPRERAREVQNALTSFAARSPNFRDRKNQTNTTRVEIIP